MCHSVVMPLTKEDLGAIAALIQPLNEKGAGLEAKVGGLEAKVVGVDTKVDTLGTTMAVFETRAASFETRMAALEAKVDDRFDQVMASLDWLVKAAETHGQENTVIRHQLTRLEHRVDALEKKAS